MIIVTGASTGIGLSISRLLAEHNYKVLATYRSEKDLVSLEHTNITPFQLDVTQADNIQSLKRYIDEHSLEITVLINNAGIVGAGPLEFYPVEEFKKVFDVNVWGLYNMTQACLPYLRKTKGKVINLSSLSGISVTPFLGPYNTSKFSVEVITDAMRMEMQDTGVQFVLIEPGSIKTPIWEKSKTQWSKLKANFPAKAMDLYGKNLDSFERLVDFSAANGISVENIAQLTLSIIKNPHPCHRYLIGKGARMTKLMNFLPSKWRDKMLWSYINKF